MCSSEQFLGPTEQNNENTSQIPILAARFTENRKRQEEFICTEPFGAEVLQVNAQTEKFPPILTESKYGYDFIKEPGGKKEFTINFFAIDKESNRTEKLIQVTVEDVENLRVGLPSGLSPEEYRSLRDLRSQIVLMCEELASCGAGVLSGVASLGSCSELNRGPSQESPAG